MPQDWSVDFKIGAEEEVETNALREITSKASRTDCWLVLDASNEILLCAQGTVISSKMTFLAI